jgi:14-3-3 protein epsilon
MEELMFKARIAEDVYRYDDMITIMKKVVEMSSEINKEQGILLSVAYMCNIGGNKTSWRIIKAAEIQEVQRQNLEKAELARCFRFLIEDELNFRIMEYVDVIKSILESKLKSVESRVEYMICMGMYLGYMAEYQIDPINENRYGTESVEKCEMVYKEALELASREMSPAHPIRLKLVLNYSLLYYLYKKLPVEACEIATTAVDQAMIDMDSLDEDQRKDSKFIIQLISDNISLWNIELKDSLK